VLTVEEQHIFFPPKPFLANFGRRYKLFVLYHYYFYGYKCVLDGCCCVKKVPKKQSSHLWTSKKEKKWKEKKNIFFFTGKMSFFASKERRARQQKSHFRPLWGMRMKLTSLWRRTRGGRGKKRRGNGTFKDRFNEKIWIPQRRNERVQWNPLFSASVHDSTALLQCADVSFWGLLASLSFFPHLSFLLRRRSADWERKRENFSFGFGFSFSSSSLLSPFSLFSLSSPFALELEACVQSILVFTTKFLVVRHFFASNRRYQKNIHLRLGISRCSATFCRWPASFLRPSFHCTLIHQEWTRNVPLLGWRPGKGTPQQCVCAVNDARAHSSSHCPAALRATTVSSKFLASLGQMGVKMQNSFLLLGIFARAGWKVMLARGEDEKREG